MNSLTTQTVACLSFNSRARCIIKSPVLNIGCKKMIIVSELSFLDLNCQTGLCLLHFNCLFWLKLSCHCHLIEYVNVCIMQYPDMLGYPGL